MIFIHIKQVIENYWDFRSKTYDTDLIYNSLLIRDQWKKMLSEKIGHKKNLRILDVGTGPGFLALLFAEMNHEVYAVDLSSEMILKAKRNAENRNLNINFYHGDAENLDFENGYFDVVVNKYLLWTLPDPSKALFEWKRVLNDGGRLILIDGEWHKSNTNEWHKSNTNNAYFYEYRKKYGSIKNNLPFYNLNPDFVLQSFNDIGLNNINREIIHKNLVANNKPVYCFSGTK